MKNRRPKHDPSWRYDCMTQRHPKQFETYSPLLPLLINISSSLHQISTYHTKLSLHLFLPVVCNWLSKFKGNTLSSENVGFLVYLFLHGSLLYLCSGFRGSHYGSPCPPIHHMKTSLESLRLTALFVRQRWVSTRKAVKWLVVICIYVFLTGSGTGYYVCCKLLEKMALCLSSVLPCVHGCFFFFFWPL